MLVNCPKCGFTQPKDQYCAQCGVDMIAFRPPTPPLLRRVLGNPVFQIGLVLVIAASGGYSIYRQRKSDLEERVRYLQSGVQVARSLTQAASDGSVDEQPTFETTPAPEALPENESAGLAETASLLTAPASGSGSEGFAKAAKAAADRGADSSAAVTTGNPRALFVFAEVSQAGLSRIYEESRASGQFNQIGDYEAGLLPQISSKLNSTNPDIKILHRIEQSLASGNGQFFLGINPGDPDHELGFTIYIERIPMDSGLSRGSLEVVRSWRERFSANEPYTLQKKNYPAIFDVPAGTGFFMSGILPPDGLLSTDQAILSMPPFQIFRSTSFRSGASDMVLFIEFLR